MKSKCALIALFLQASSAFSVTSTWQGPGLVWNTPASWMPNMVPNGVGDEADFINPAIVAPAAPNISITLTPVILGSMVFDSTASYTISTAAGGSLSFTVSASNNAGITVRDSLTPPGMHTIATTFALNSPFIVQQDSTADFIISGIITGGQTVTLQGTGLLYLSGGNTYSGGTIISGGTLKIDTDGNLGAPAPVAVTIGDGILQINGPGFTSARPVSLTGNASINITALAVSSSLTGVMSGAGSLTKTNSGTLVLSGPAVNTYTGGTIISAGTLSISNDNKLGTGTLTLGNGTLLATGPITSTRSGYITSTATINTGGFPINFSGAFGGGGSLTLTGLDTVTLTGANTYTGPTTVDIGTQLAGTTTGIQGNIILNAMTSRLTFSQNFDGTYGGIISSVMPFPNGGEITKLGTGIVTLSNASNAFFGSTAINEGTLNVTGSITGAGSTVTVSSSGTLSGTGTVGSTTSSGTIDPGSGTTIGTLSINGNLVLNPSSKVNINLAPLSADKIVVSGTAMLDGGLSIDPTAGFYGFSADYTILSSTGLAGMFVPALITTTNPAFAPFVIYTATDALLHIVISEPFAVFPFSNFNTAAVGNNIDALYAANQLSPDMFNIFNTFVGQSFAVINNALNQMHPAPYSAFTEMQTELSGQLLSLFHRLPYLPCACSNPNRLWIEPFGNTLTMKRHGLEIGFQANSGGLAFGYDGQILENFVIGVGGAWSHSHLDWHDHRGHGDVNGLYGGFYFDSQVDSFYFGGSFLAGGDFYETSRHMNFLTTNRHATASYKALDIMAQISTAYLFGSPQAFFYPYANLDYLYLNTKEFSESGADGLNLTVQQHTDATLRTEMGLGLQVQDTNAAETMCISPLVSLGWVNMVPLSRPLLKSTFEGATIPFAVRGWDETWNLLNANFGLTIAYRCYSLSLKYNVEISPNSDTILFNQHGDLRLDWKW